MSTKIYLNAQNVALTDTNKKQTYLKKFKYLPLLPRIRRMFLQEHCSLASPSEHSSLQDIHEKDMWKGMFAFNGRYKGDPRVLSLSLCTDGLNPFSKERTSYSIWPIMLKVLNFPSHIRANFKSLILMGIIPGRREPRKIDPYLDLLVEDILDFPRKLFMIHIKMKLLLLSPV